MRIILLGSPGAGKGTQGKLLAQHFQIPQIATGDMLRSAIQAGTALGKKVKDIMDSGQLVPDHLIIELVKVRIHQEDCAKGFILDGFPRTVAQAEALRQQKIDINAVVEITVPEPEVVKRLSGRRVHLASGRVYHVVFNPPQVQDKDDMTGDPLIQRDDDREETIRQRLKVYRQQTEPLIAYYKNGEGPKVAEYIRVDGSEPVEVVQQKILSALKKWR